MDVVVIAVHVVKVFDVMFLFKISAICNTFFGWPKIKTDLPKLYLFEKTISFVLFEF